MTQVLFTSIASQKSLNLGLRCITLGARFLFIFFLARYLEPSSIGHFGIFTVTVSYALFFVGLDFYTFATREIIKTPANQRGKLLKGQAAVSGILYLALLPLAVGLLSQSSWPDPLIWWFVPIVFLEHINQEISRIFTALSEQIASSLILFIRQGSWNLIAIFLMSVDPSTRNLNIVMPLWAIAGFIALSLGVWRLNKLKTEGWHLPIDWAWVRQGIVVSAAFLVATLALRGLQTFDRYWLEDLGGIELVAGYVLMQGVASVLMIFLESTLFAFSYPALIKCHHEGKHQEARQQVRHMLFQTILFSALFSLVSWILLPYFLAWVGNPVYQQAIALYPWVLSAVVINAISMVAHFALYAQGKDKPIIYSNIGALLVFVITTWLFSRTHAGLAVPIGLNAAFFCILIWQSIAYMLLVRQENRTVTT
jgi:O-antigen/teichoic acid export membrane protein